MTLDGRNFASESGDIMKQGFMPSTAGPARESNRLIGICLACLVNSFRKH